MLFVGDHPVMDLLNTVYRAPEGITDALARDEDVLTWAKGAGVPLGQAAGLPAGELLRAARKLREILRVVLTRRQEGKPARYTALNSFLAQGRSYLELRDGTTVRRYLAETPEQVLTPVAELAAEFLVTADPELIRRCEGKDCVLWFYDRTKSHRRRWCSMAACGNRAKVAAFRAR